MALANTIWMWGLFALSVPVIIHLLSRKEGRIVDVGSIRHLQESPTAQFRSVRPNEILLFVLRCLLITLIVLLLAGLTLNEMGSARRWIVVEPGLEENARLKALVDSLPDFEVRFLATDFPKLDEKESISAVRSYWPLLAKLSERELDSAIVLAFGHAQKFKGVRVPVSPAIQWITVESEWKQNSVRVASVGRDSVLERKAVLVGNNLHLTSEKTNQASADALIQNPIRIDVVADDAFDFRAKLITAALHAVADNTPGPLVITRRRPSDQVVAGSDWTIWLSEKTPSALKGRTIGLARCETNEVDIVDRYHPGACRKATENFDFFVTGALDQENILKSAFIQRLANVLFQKYQYPEIDQRVLDEGFLKAGQLFVQRASPGSRAEKSASGWLAVAIAATFVFERYISFKRRQ